MNLRIKMKYETIKNVVTWFFFIALTIFILHKIIVSPGVIAFHDWAMPPYTDQIVNFLMNLPYVWRSSFCGWDISTINYGLGEWLIIGFPAFLGANGEIITKGMIVFSLSLSGFSLYYLCISQTKSYLPSLIAGIFYMFTPWIFNRITAGDFYGMISYPIIPLVFYFFIKSVEGSKGKVIVKYPLLIGFLIFFIGPIYGVILVGSLILYSIISVICSRKHKLELMANVKALTVIFCILFLIYSYWILPLLPFRGGTGIPLTIQDVILRSRNAQVINVIRLTGQVIEWFLDTATQIGIIWVITSLLLTSLVWFAPVIGYRNRNVIFFSLLAILSFFLGKGINPPGGNIFGWLFLNVPYFQMFRDPYYILVLACPAYAFLLCKTVQWLDQHLCISIRKICYFITHNEKYISLKYTRKYFSIVLTLILCALILINSWPFLTGDFNGNLHPISFPEEYRTINNWLAEQSGDFRVLWLPPYPTIQYDWAPYHSDGIPQDLMAGYSPKPSFLTYPLMDDTSRFTYFVASLSYQNRTRFLGKLLAIANVKYIILRNDAESGYYYYYGWPYTRDQLEYTIQQQSGIRLVKREGAISVFQNDYYMPHLFTTSAASIITGGYSSLISLSYLDNFSFEDSALFFADQLSSNDSLNILRNADDVVIQDGSFNDLAFSLLPERYKIDASAYATTYDTQDHWSKLYYWWSWYDSAYLDAVEECAFTRGEATLNIPFSAPTSGTYDVWIKLFFGLKGTFLDVIIDNETIGGIDTGLLQNSGFRSIYLNSVTLASGNHAIELKNDGAGENVVAQIVVAPKELITRSMEAVTNLLYDKRITLIYEAERFKLETPPYVVDNKVSPTTISTCDSVTNWHAPYGGTFSTDTSIYKEENGSIRFSGGPYLIYNPPSALNFSDKEFVTFWVRSNADFRNQTVTVAFRTNGFTDYYAFNTFPNSWLANTWYEVTLSKSQFKVSGAPNWSNISDIAFGVGKGNTLWVDDIRIWNKKFPEVDFTENFCDVANWVYGGGNTEYNFTSTFTSDGDVANLTVTSGRASYWSCYFTDTSIDSETYQFFRVRLKGTNNALYKFGFYDGANWYFYPSTYVFAPDSWSVKQFDLKSLTGGKTIKKIVIYAMKADGSKASLFMDWIQVYGTSWMVSDKYGSNASQGLSLMINKPGKISSSISIPKDGDYEIYLRALGNSTPIMQIQNEQFHIPLNPSSDFRWYRVGETHLEQGSNNLSFISNGYDEIYLDQLLIRSTNQPLPMKPTNLTYEKINPSRYVIHVESQKPYFLVLSESINPLWRAYINEKSIEPVPAYSFLNSFFINETGKNTIIIEFVKQKYYDIGLVISLVSFSAIIVFCVFEKLKKKTYRI